MKKILVTGGAGYVGTTLIPMLLERNYEVTIIDNLMFGNGDKLIPFINNKNFSFIEGDIRDEKLVASLVKGKDIIIHLAAYVGFPLCRLKGEHESYEVNTQASRFLANVLEEEQYLLFGSTGSNYGEVTVLCTEETPLNPLSIYGKTKTEAEQIVMGRKNSTAFRFATAFGVSPRMRLDLLVNDLTHKAMTEGYAVIYESHFLRTFIHVRDLARSFIFAIDNQEEMVSNVYNVGSNAMNHTKKRVCEMINERVPDAYFHYADIREDVDKRNYQVCYQKINSLGYEIETTLEEGVNELKLAIPLIKEQTKYRNV
jgi:nucleoside-diphosphate-sugar epimerase